MTRKRKSPGLDLVVFGTRLRISWTFPIAILVLGFHLRDRPVELVTLAVLLTTSVLVHESGHVVALRKFGHHPRVELGWLGGLTISEERRALTPTRSIIVSLAGPAFGIALGIIIEVMTFWMDGQFWSFLRNASLLINIGWSFLNLLPILPLDGGHVNRELFILASRKKGPALATLFSTAFALLAAVAAYVMDLAGGGVAVILGIMVATNLRYLAITPGQRASERSRLAHEHLLADDFTTGTAELQQLIAEGFGARISTEAYTTLGWALLHQGRYEDLSRLDFSRMPTHHSSLLWAAAAWFRGEVHGAVNAIAGVLQSGSFTPPPDYFDRVLTRFGERDLLTQALTNSPFRRTQQGAAVLGATLR
ncbi:MAG TPA: hypothetical protein DEG43_03415 [Acidimicrobiaceae bacterium]|jgi:Zn-dependent protease|nr:hypothetical protein [Acidimicrobiaceae bacterium]